MKSNGKLGANANSTPYSLQLPCVKLYSEENNSLHDSELCSIRNSNHADILNTFKELHVKLLFDFLANMWISQSIETPAVNNQSCTFIYYYAGL